MKISRAFGLACVLCLPGISGCDTSEATQAVLANEYPAPGAAPFADSMVVYKGWWAVAQFPGPLAPGQVSDTVRVVEGTDYGYALLAPGWDASLGAPPSHLIPVRSVQELSVARGDTLNFAVSDTATVGNCAAGNPLAQADADFITQRIFQSEFRNLVYDAASCSASPALGAEDGSESMPEAGASGI